MGSIEKGVYAIDPNKSVCCVGAGVSMAQEGNTNSALFISWCLSRHKDNNTGSVLQLGIGYNTQPLISKDYQIVSGNSYNVNIDSVSTYPSYGSCAFCVEYLDE